MKYLRTLFILFLITLICVSCSKNVVYNVGDIVMDDGTVMTAAELEAYGGAAKPMAIIFSITGGDHENSSRVLGVGLNASEGLAFSPENTTGYKTNVLENYSIVVAQNYSITDGLYSNKGFYGLLDGRKTWSNVCKYDKEVRKTYAGYPAYGYAANYGIDNGFKKFEKGWYMPTASEAVALSKCEIPALPAIIWTSSQSYDAPVNELVVDLTNGYVETGFKEMEYAVCSIYCFAE